MVRARPATRPTLTDHCKRMNIIGVSAFYHESACCLLQDGNLVAAAAEERFTRLKHDPRLPVHAFRYCLQAAGLTIADVDCIAYYESPHKKLSRQEWSLARQRVPTPNPRLDAAMPERLMASIEESPVST